MNTDRRHVSLRRLAIASIAPWAVALVLPLAPRAAQADDRGLLQATQMNPYVFIILDTSGSMHQEVSCTDADIAAGICGQQELCPPGDCLPRLMGDDPASKIYVAKSAIYAIMQKHLGINFGFGHFDQSQLRVIWKYWWYQVSPTNTKFIQLDSGSKGIFPAPRQEELFGQQAWACTAGGFGGTNLNQIGCVETSPAHLDNAWEFERARRYPKLGDANNAAPWGYFFQEKTGVPGPTNPTYKATFAPVAGQTLGTPTLQVKVSVDRCLTAACTNAGAVAVTNSPQVMTFNLANQTVYWDNPVELTGSNFPDANGNGGNFYGGNPWTAHEVIANYSNANHQLEPNTDTATVDPWSLNCKNVGGVGPTPWCDLEQLTTPDPLGRTPANSFSIGDIIPLDWKTDQQTLISQRMAPNLLGNALPFCLDPPACSVPSPCACPDFSISSYMQDHPAAGEAGVGLELKNSAQRPLAPEGGTPTGNVMMSYFNLLTGSSWPGAFSLQASNNSWIGTASSAGGDPFFSSCKPSYVLILTDGLASGDDGNWNSDPRVCPQYFGWNKVNNPAPGFACCAAEALRSITYGPSKLPYPVRTYIIGLGLTTAAVGGYNNTLQCVADEGGTGNRHFYNGDTTTGSPPGFPVKDPPPPCCTAADHARPTSDPFYCAPVTSGSCYCCSPEDLAAGHCNGPANPCDGPGPILPRNKQDVVNALTKLLNSIQAGTASFASAAVPTIQSNVSNKTLISSFLPVPGPFWPGRVDAYTDPVPVRQDPKTGIIAPDPTAACTSSGQESCHLWNAGGGKSSDLNNPPGTDQILAQGLNGFDTNGTDPSKRRIYYAYYPPPPAPPPPPQPPPPNPGERRFFQMPQPTDSLHLNDLENAMGLCGPGYTFYPPTSAVCTENTAPPSGVCTGVPPPTSTNPCPPNQTASSAQFTQAQTTVNFTEQIKTYVDPNTKLTVQFLLGDIFHSDPALVGQPINVTLFDGNVDNYQTFANQERFRRKVLYFGSNDGQLHAIDVGIVRQGTVAGKPAWVFSDGTGSEIFSFIPRTVMPSLDQLAASGGSETFMVDGPPHLAEGFFDATSGGTSKQWHSVLVGGLREGGHGYYALDVTQPDVLQSGLFETPGDSTTLPVQLPDPNASTYLPNCINGGSSCGQLAYPTPLWEFTDSCKVVQACATTNCVQQPCDEDASGPGKGHPDLGQAWSRPNSGRVRICDTVACNTFHEQWVVVFGGGMDPAANNSQGNYLYMLDMASGQVIYKRPLNGSVPSEPAAVDTGQDGYIDTIYVGTTAGHLYKVDLSAPAPIVAVPGLGNRVSATFWQPFEIFDTVDTLGQRRQMFYPPAVFFIADLNQYGLAWGTGNRQDLWKNDPTTGRFYVLVDTGFTAANSMPPLTAASLQQINPDSTTPTGGNLLTTPQPGKAPGFFFELTPGERLLNEATTLSGALVFVSYEPKPVTSTTNNNTVCADTGDTRVFVVNITNGDFLSGLTASRGTVIPPTPSNRYFVLGGAFGASIGFSESTPTKNLNVPCPNPPCPPCPNPPCPPAPCPNPPCVVGCGTNTTPAGKAASADMIKSIELLMPSNCRFITAKTFCITVNLSNQSQVEAVEVPACIIEKNWKEF
jgi:hypothetical protein